MTGGSTMELPYIPVTLLESQMDRDAEFYRE